MWLILSSIKAKENLEWLKHDFVFNPLVYWELLTFPLWYWGALLSVAALCSDEEESTRSALLNAIELDYKNFLQNANAAYLRFVYSLKIRSQ